MVLIDLGEAQRLAVEDEFWKTRALAMQSYASLEQAVCRIFGYLTGTNAETAALIFFQLRPYSQRKIIAILTAKRFGTQYEPFMKSLLNHLEKLGATRNKVVHWNTVVDAGLDADGRTTATLSLLPPDQRWAEPAPPMRHEDLVDFRKRCDFLASTCGNFLLVAFQAVDEPASVPEHVMRDLWEVCSRPIEYSGEGLPAHMLMGATYVIR